MVSAGEPALCPHVPITDEDKWNNPQDHWCEECFMTMCKNCFSGHTAHKYHIDQFTDQEWQVKVESIPGATNDFTPEAPTPVEIITAVITDEQLTEEQQRRAAADQARFNEGT